MQSTSCTCQAGWITSWSHECQEKYQQLQICKWYHPNGRMWRTTKELLDEGERRKWKSWLKIQHSKNKDHGIWTHQFMEKMGKNGNSGRFYFLWGPKSLQTVTAAMKFKVLAPWKKSYDWPGRHIWSWTKKKAEHKRIDAFELWYWRRLLRVPLTARKSNQSILKEINPEYSLKGLMLKLKLQYFGHLMWQAGSLERPRCCERLKAKGEGGGREWDG